MGRFMPSIGISLSRLRTLRDLFEKRLKAASGKWSGTPARPSRLHEIANFGSNPGNLRRHVYVPDSVDPSPPLVIALHGCTQTAASYDHGAGWSHLADRLGFILVFPEQQAANNPKSCFSWFLPGDTTRDSGEALSIREMIAKAVDKYGVDRSRIFVTGLSAGGAMASAMLATYPEILLVAPSLAGCLTARRHPCRKPSRRCSTSAHRRLARWVTMFAQPPSIADPGQRYRYGTARPTLLSGRQTQITSSNNGSMCRSCRNAPQARNRSGGIRAASGKTQRRLAA
jgi:poly(hydroxyalkanoate) depolymerase family esterase